MTLPAVIPESCPVAHSHAVELGAWADRLSEGRRINRNDRLMPRAELQKAVQELEAALQPADYTAVGKWVRNLIGGYRVSDKAFRDEQHVETFIHSLSFDLAEFPEDIIKRTVHETRRSCKFLPSCAEVYQHAKGLLAERQALLRAAQAQIREHERRQQERERQEEKLAPSNLTPEQRERVDNMFRKMRAP